MAFSTATVSVTVGAAIILVNPTTGSVSDPVPVVIFNNDATNTIFLGGANVTAGTGVPILKQTGISFRLMASDPVYAIATGGTCDTRVMIGRQ